MEPNKRCITFFLNSYKLSTAITFIMAASVLNNANPLLERLYESPL